MDTLERIYDSNKSFVENENFKGVKKIIVDNYSDEAHFVYEMLQNADDAKASEITFNLLEDKLIVTHDGIAFDEKDLEGICSISKGTKSDDYTKIGKFGIGFKSVFVYTESPQVHSGIYDFEIRELVLPKKIKSEFKEDNKTVFVLPFNAKKTKDIAWERIKNKLESLHEEAIIFLKNIKKINILTDEDSETIEKTILSSDDFFENTEYEHIRITKLESGREYDEESDEASFYYLMKRNHIVLTDTNDDGESVEVPDQTVMIAYVEVDGDVSSISDDYFSDHEDCFFVFFPTRIPSNCEFLVHAPFVTKSSRDTIALNNKANDDLMRNLGILVADSMIVLAKENQLSIDLIESLYFNDSEGFGSDILFKSFKEEYGKLLKGRRAIIPCDDGTYRSLQSVLFTSESNEDCELISSLLGMKWLSEFYELKNQANICHVGTSSHYFDFMQDEFDCQKLEMVSIFNSLDKKYYEQQTTEWFANYLGLMVYGGYYGYSVRYNNLDKLPLIRTKRHKHFTLEKAGNVYLNNGTLDEELLEDPKVLYLYKDVFKIKEYSTELNDAKAAMKKLSSEDEIDFEEQVELLRKILIAIDDKKISVDDISNKQLFCVVNQENGESRRTVPNKALVGKWERTNGTFDLYVLCQGVDIDLLDPRYLEYFNTQELKRLGCNTSGLTFEKGGLDEVYRLNGHPGYLRWDAPHIRPLTGKANNKQFQPTYQMLKFDEIVESPMTIEKSVIILRLAKEFDSQIKDWVQWSSRKDFAESASQGGYEEFYSLFGGTLTNSSWLFDKENNIYQPSEISVDELNDAYRKIMTADIADKIGIKTSTSEKMLNVNKKLESDGLYAIPLSEKEEFEEFLRLKRERKAQFNDSNVPPTTNEKTDSFHDDIDDTLSAITEEPIANVIKDIAKKTSKKDKKEKNPFKEPQIEDLDVDGDEFIQPTVDYSKKIERAKQKSAAEIDRIAYIEELQQRAVEAEKYSYEWFNCLLEMESINSGETNANSKEVSISFGKVELEPGTKRTLVLKHPNRYIPQFMEDLADIPLVLHMGDQTKTVAIEVANIKSYTLRVKLKNATDIEGIDLETVTSATIDAKSPVFLLEELRKQFAELGFDDDYNMQENLCENIEFVFGPPGTGKTTHLAQNVLLPMMRENKECKVLVLTPTNKSADVLVRRIMEVSGNDHTYNRWLVRFGATGDEEIEQSPVYREKTFDIRTLEKNVTVTTIARFPYDFFMPQGARVFLHGINWDYIVIDEASMIPIANIVYPLYKKTPRKFIIAGDPFQIEPITSVDLWKNENIYTMVNLDSFVAPQTVPYQYKVELLTTQYRSVPDIGDVFSNFAYGGILHHYRTADSQRALNVSNDLGIETLNIIKFPVSKYESIYRCKRLQHSSSYQVYSALFTFEYVCYLSKAIAENNPGELYKIGVIAPYRAQADMIDKLLASEKLPKEIDVQVGTIHGFQGDECDIIFAVFNTPPTISASNDMFLNKKNIINVSISRARDYLFVVMPDDNTDNIENLRLVNRVEELIHDTNAWTEFLSPNLEDLMFGDSKYLENNAFSTGHQSVNVYGLPEKRYEVRTEDTAVDVQIHKQLKSDGIKTSSGAEDLEKVDVDEYIDSYQLKEELIPEELRKGAIDLPVKGAIKGWCYLVPYEGKLKSHTIKKTDGMFIPLVRNGQEKMVSVSVVPEDRIIYISQDMFKLYEQALSEPEGIELRTSFF